MSFVFGEFELDERRVTLKKSGVEVAARPRVFAALTMLLRHRDRVVSKDELARELWPREAVTDSSLTHCIWALRRVLGDSSRRSRFVRTVHSRGYQFIAPVTEQLRQRGGRFDQRHSAHDDPDESQAELWLTDKSPVRFAAADSRAEIPLIERREVLSTLRRLIEASDRRVAYLCLVEGEFGMGKSRLIRAFAADARRKGLEVITASCRDDSAENPSTGLVARIMRLSSEYSGASERVRPAARDLRAQSGTHSRETAPVEWQRTIQPAEAIEVIRQAGQSRPIAILLDDAHRADASTVGFLERLARAPVTPAVVLATYDANEVKPGSPGEDLPSLLSIYSRSEHIELANLSPAGVAQFLASFGAFEVSTGLANEVHDATGGNPLFVREYGSHLRANNRPRNGGADQSSISAAISEVPVGLKIIVHRTLRRLSAKSRRLLALSALLGRRFPYKLLEQLTTGIDTESIIEAVEEAEAAKVIDLSLVQEGIQFEFRQDVVRRTLVADMSIVRHRYYSGLIRRTVGPNPRIHSCGEHSPDRYTPPERSPS